MFVCGTTPMTCLARAGWATTSMPPTAARAAGRDDPGREHADGRGLARAVRAEQPEDLARVHREVEPVDGPHLPARPPKTLVSPSVRMTSSAALEPRFPECDLDGHGTPSPPDGYVMKVGAYDWRNGGS